MTTPMTPGSPTTAIGTTGSTQQIYGMLRQRILAYVDRNGVSLGDFIGGVAAPRFYNIRAPDPSTAIFPYCVMRVTNWRSDTGRIARVTADLEIQAFGRPWAQLPDVQHMADLIVSVMTGFVSITQGLTFSRQWQRDELPMPSAPADSETCTIRLLFPLVLWPALLTQLAVNSPT
jgi:hypothetical protein